MRDTSPSTPSFHDLNLPAPLLATLDKVGYETPTPIQAQTIPHLLKGLDLLGHAPTGTGKTAAFALPLLSRLDIDRRQIQLMVLTPTRELAIQVAEAFQRYASHIKGFHVLPIYGGQDYTGQIRQLKRGVHAIVGTPGRLMDHMRKDRLKLDTLQALVLDEADEMLRMGFIDDVEWILDQTPEQRQMALFSATMPKEIQRIARRYLHDPQEIAIKTRTATPVTIRQRYWLVSGLHKLDALTRILEVEPFEAILMFVRTKIATAELAERLEARGYAAAALNGDMAQKHREQMIERLKRGSLDILVATDVAARGLDVERISHVVNYDIPYDAEAYIHRIGRTGRAGRQGDAILFVAPRERRMLNAIERATRQKIERLELPSTEMVNNKRIANFKQSISDTLAAGELDFMQSLVEQYQQEHDVPALEIAAALAKMTIGDRQLLLKPEKPASRARAERKPRQERAKPHQRKPQTRPTRPAKGLEQFRIEVGHQHEVKPGNIVGAIANEAGLDAQHIGHIDIHTEFSLVDLPKGMPNEVFQDLRKAWVCGQRLNISRMEQAGKKKGGHKTNKKRKRTAS
ncbi:MAG: DEAD/DEAH box helicase [Gammaproteobacteria bacterium]|nr:DEAD/DEAH box helicase [Gammaproteobacteria bacterium]